MSNRDRVPSDKMDRFREACRRAGLRMTPQRMEIYREVACACDHPDAEAIRSRLHDRLPHLSLDTVYRTLALFEDLALVHRVPSPAGRARFDAETDMHQHFVCSVCGTLWDFQSDAINTLTPPVEANRLGEVHSLHVLARGVCQACGKTTKR